MRIVDHIVEEGFAFGAEFAVLHAVIKGALGGAIFGGSFIGGHGLGGGDEWIGGVPRRRFSATSHRQYDRMISLEIQLKDAGISGC